MGGVEGAERDCEGIEDATTSIYRKATHPGATHLDIFSLTRTTINLPCLVHHQVHVLLRHFALNIS